MRRAESCHQQPSAPAASPVLAEGVCARTHVLGRQGSVQGLRGNGSQVGHVLCSGKSPGITGPLS